MPGFPGIPDQYRPPRPSTPKPDFFTSPNPDILEDPAPSPDRLPDKDDACQCDKAPKKPKKKRKERDVCKQGTYTQRAKGIKYSPKRTVPCEGEIQPESKAKSSKPKRRRSVPSLNDVLSTPF